MADLSESALHKTFSVVEYLGGAKRKVSLPELSEALSLSEMAAHRLLNGLMDLGYVAQDEGKYYLTYKIYRLAGKSVNRDNDLKNMLPYMNYFALRYGCEVGLTVFWEDSIVHLINVGKSISFGGEALRPGQRFPLYCSAGGKVFLSQMSPECFEDWLGANTLLPYTHRTIIDPEKLRGDIQRTREQGYGISEGELYNIVYAVAFPIHNKGTVEGTFNFRMLPEVYQERMSGSFVQDVKKAIENFGL